MTNEQIALELTKVAIPIIKQYENNYNNPILQKQLTRKFLAVLNKLDPKPETTTKFTKIVKFFGPHG
ncbi:MAG: hypothetical protein LBH59_09210 [Planctomycetaceae bacterium]|jgi:hypothetical protein|nr:hypothetical protein [Planctomycetaceae bacterium]